MTWTWWMTLLVIFGVLFLIGCIPVGVDAQKTPEDLILKVKVWFWKLQLLPKDPEEAQKPGKEKKKKEKKKKEPAQKPAKPEKPAKPSKPENPNKPAKPPKPKKEKTPILKTVDTWELVDLGVDSALRALNILSDTLGNLRRKLRLEELTLHVTFSGADPAKAAISYGRAWAAIGAMTPLLERLFVIKKRDIQPTLDYNEKEMKIEGRVVLTITIGRIVSLALRAVGRVLSLGISAGFRFLRLQRKYKKAVQKNESSSV